MVYRLYFHPQIDPITGLIPISGGGTGADTAAGAAANLNVVSKAGDTMTGSLLITLPVDGGVNGSLVIQNETITPSGFSGQATVLQTTYAGAQAVGSQTQYRTALGSSASPSDLTVDHLIGNLIFAGYSGGSFRNVASINARVGSGTISSTSLPSYIRFDTTPDGSVTRAERMRINSNGNVGIGDTAPDYKLDVNGTFGMAPGASVTPVSNGDIVFEFTNNSTITIKGKGSDGTVRSAVILLT